MLSNFEGLCQCPLICRYAEDAQASDVFVRGTTGLRVCNTLLLATLKTAGFPGARAGLRASQQACILPGPRMFRP
eukprot:111173-Chlamydomonas_euryale.AAC.1